MAAAQEPTDNTVIIGIDFGTTYSGVAFTWSKKIERMEIVSSWDSNLHSNSDNQKTPTALSFGPKTNVNWGYGIPHDAEQIRWFKLLIVDEEDLPEDVRKSSKIKEARDYLKKHGKTAIEVIALFLRHLWNHSIQRIIETIGRGLVNFSKFHIVITLPAIWPGYARVRMQEAASLAGMLGNRIAGETKLSFISEPEAAAMATLSGMDGRCDIKAGDTFVVVDCGGGTADLISYEVVTISPMVVKECVKGQGGLCGAVFVDEAFADMLEKKFGAVKWAKLTAESRQQLLNHEWEHMIKPEFDGREHTWHLKEPFECVDLKPLRAGAAWPTIPLNAVDVGGVFDPSVNKIRAMVDDQVAEVRIKKGEDPKFIIMAGGFGRSKYLFTTLKKHLNDGIEVLQSRGPGPWTAICRGAVIHATTITGISAFSVQVQARIARVSCGIAVREEWSSNKHAKKDKAWSESRQAWRAKDQMKWLLKVGDDISTSKGVRYHLEKLFSTDRTERSTTTTICSSVKSPPPKRMNGSVKTLCSIKWDTEIDIPFLPTYTNPLGKVYYKLEHELEMTCVAGSLDFAVYHNGKRQGSKHVVVDYETKS